MVLVGSSSHYFLYENWGLIKQQSAAWACIVRQALVSCVSGISSSATAQHSAGSIILLLEEVECQAPEDYVLLPKQWVETDGKGCCTLAHLLSISLLLDVPHICQLLPFNWEFRCSPFGLRRGQTLAHQSSRRMDLAKQMQAFDNQGHAHPSNKCAGQSVSVVRWLVEPSTIKDCEFLSRFLFWKQFKQTHISWVVIVTLSLC